MLATLYMLSHTTNLAPAPEVAAASPNALVAPVFPTPAEHLPPSLQNISTTFSNAFASLPALTTLPTRLRESLPWTSESGRGWDFSGTGIRESEVSSFLATRAPSAVVYFDKNGIIQYIKDPSLSAQEIQYLLFVGDAQHIQQMAQSRREESAQNQNNADAESAEARENSDTENSREKRLAENAFEVFSFKPGRRDNGSELQPVATDLRAALQGPDYSLAPFNWRDPEEMRRHLSRVLSFGHGGELTLKIGEGGYLKNGEGFDFTLYENAFRTESGHNIVQEFARVGVSEHVEGPYTWFPCEPSRNQLSGCLGSVPSSEGGDQFDLGTIGVARARFIRIRDIGVNYNKTSEWPTEGCDLDAVRLLHAYTEN